MKKSVLVDRRCLSLHATLPDDRRLQYEYQVEIGHSSYCYDSGVGEDEVPYWTCLDIGEHGRAGLLGSHVVGFVYDGALDSAPDEEEIFTEDVV